MTMRPNPLQSYSDAQLKVIDELLDNLLDLPEPERADWLEQQISNHPALGATLAPMRLQLARFASEHAHTASLSAQKSADHAPRLSPGTRLGHWQILEFAASGGSADVYRGERADAQFQREVAIKVLREQSADWQVRFARERELLANLEHAHIASLLDAGVTQAGLSYIVMPWLAGVNFSSWCRPTQDAQSLSAREKLNRFVRLVDAVAYAHQRLVIHRDLKPNNIRSDAAGQLQLLDFGISALLEPPDLNVANQPHPATLNALTPSYASPEQLSGQAASTLSDIHGLGLLLFELLLDQPAYPEASRSLAHAVQSICGPNLPGISIARLRTDWSKSQAQDLRAVLTRCLQKPPALRFPSALELAADLRAVLANRATQTRPRSTSQRVFGALQHYPLRFALGAGALIASGIFASVYVKQNQQIAIERNEALAQVKRLEALREHFSLILRDGGSGANSARAALDESTRNLSLSYQNSPTEHAQLLLSLGEIYLVAGDNQAVQSVLQNLVNSPILIDSLTETQRSQAFETLIFAGLRIAKPEQVNAWLQAWKQSLPQDSTRAAHARWQIAAAMLVRQTGDASAAFNAQLAAVQRLNSATDATPLSVGIAWSNLGSSALQLGDLAEAEQYLQLALSVWKKSGIEENDNVRTAQTNLGHVNALRGDPVGALAQYLPVETALRARGANNAPFAALLNGIARSAMQLGDFEKALLYARDSGEILERLSGPASLDVLGTLLTQLEAQDYLKKDTQALVRRIEEIIQPLPDAHPLRLRAQLSVLRLRHLQNPNDQSLAGEFEALTDRAAASAPSLKPTAIRSYFDLAASTGRTSTATLVAKALLLIDPKSVNSLDRLEGELWLGCLGQLDQPISAIQHAKFDVISADHPRYLALQACLAKSDPNKTQL